AERRHRNLLLGQRGEVRAVVDVDLAALEHEPEIRKAAAVAPLLDSHQLGVPLTLAGESDSFDLVGGARREIDVDEPPGRDAGGEDFSNQRDGVPLIRKILAAGIAPGGLVNVNFPACAAGEVEGVAFTRQGRRNAELMRVEQRRDGRGFPYYWLMFQRGEISFGDGTDLAALAAQKISVTPLRLDLTADDERLRLEEAFAAR